MQNRTRCVADLPRCLQTRYGETKRAGGRAGGEVEERRRAWVEGERRGAIREGSDVEVVVSCLMSR